MSNNEGSEANNSPPPPPPPPPKIFSPIGPGNHERAWNDPPMFSTEFNISGRAAPNKLNKRVAHPISSGPYGGGPPVPVLAPQSSETLAQMPPMPSATNFPPASSGVVAPQGYSAANVPPSFDLFMNRGN